MLLQAAEDACISIPTIDVDSEEWHKEEYPQWTVLCATQLGRAMDHGEHRENAKQLAKIPVEELKTMTWNELADRGVCPHAY